MRQEGTRDLDRLSRVGQGLYRYRDHLIRCHWTYKWTVSHADGYLNVAMTLEDGMNLVDSRFRRGKVKEE